MFWPSIDTPEDAEKAAHAGAGVAFFSAFATAAVAVLAISGHHFIKGIDGSSLIDAVLLALIGFWIYRKSRIAAILGFFYYLANIAYMGAVNGIHYSPAMAIFLLAFLGSIRGTFAYHDFLKSEEGPQNPSAEIRKGSRFLGVLLWTISLSILILIAAWIAGLRIHPEVFSRTKTSGRMVRMELKSGSTIEGAVIEESGQAVSMNIEGGSVEFSRAEIQSITPLKKNESKSGSLFGTSDSLITWRPQDRLFRFSHHSVRVAPAASPAATSSPSGSFVPNYTAVIQRMLEASNRAQAQVAAQKAEDEKRARETY